MGCGGDIVSDVAQSLEGEAASGTILGEGALGIFVVDVGQGDATLVVGPSVAGRRVSLLIDAGALDPDGGAVLEALFEEVGLDGLGYFVLTHFDGDHMGGAVSLGGGWSRSLFWDEACVPSAYFPTEAIIDLGDTDKDTYSVLEYLACRDSNAGLLHEGHIAVGGTGPENIGYEMDLGGGYVATVVAGNGYVLGESEPVPGVDTENEKSIAVLVSGPGGFGFLVTGDLTGAVYGEEDALVETHLGEALLSHGLSVSILRVGHHGSANASSSEFLEAIRPEVAIISVGANSHGLPHCAALTRLVVAVPRVIQTGAGSTDQDCSAAEEVAIQAGTVTIVVENGKYAMP